MHLKSPRVWFSYTYVLKQYFLSRSWTIKICSKTFDENVLINPDNDRNNECQMDLEKNKKVDYMNDSII